MPGPSLTYTLKPYDNHQNVILNAVLQLRQLKFREIKN